MIYTTLNGANSNKSKSKIWFIKNEIWSLSIAGAFQRAFIYVEEAKEIEKLNFKSDLRAFVDNISEIYSEKEVEEELHLEKINSIVYFFNSYKIIHNNKFGVAQKLLNLYLKYLWVLGIIKTPPHFPIDRQIQYALGRKENEIISWTEMESSIEYLKIINLARAKISEEVSLAVYELTLFNKYLEKKNS